MTDQDLVNRFDSLERKIDAAAKSVDQMRKFFLWTLVATAVGFILPLIGLAFAIPWYLSSLQGLL